MELLQPYAQAYPWGSRTMIPAMNGEPAAQRPIAELWYGAHPGGPTATPNAAQNTLAEVIAANPDTQLGDKAIQQYGEKLPFLLKLLAADQPLSLQAHPSLAQAKEGFEKENQAGIALHANNRNYKDDNHKPELIVALTRFDAMAGFRPLKQTRELFAVLDCPGLDRALAMLSNDPARESDDLRTLFTTWISIPHGARVELIDAVVTSATKLLRSGAALPEPWMEQTLKNILELAERYPGDMGILGALLLNHITINPGEAIFLDAGNLHAYIRGLGVEIMANSDNVLRGGLTSKYVDVPELVRVLRFESLADPIVHATDGTYPVPTGEFLLQHQKVTGQHTVEHSGPCMVLVTEGEIAVEDTQLRPTDAIWVAATDPALTLRGEGEVFIARVGSSEQ